MAFEGSSPTCPANQSRLSGLCPAQGNLREVSVSWPSVGESPARCCPEFGRERRNFRRGSLERRRVGWSRPCCRGAGAGRVGSVFRL